MNANSISQNGPPPLHRQELTKEEASCLRKATYGSLVGALVLCGASIMILINEAKPLDLKCFAVFLILSSLIGVFGLIRQNKNLSRAAYVTFGVMLFGFPVGTILGIFGIKWMNSILPKLQ